MAGESVSSSTASYAIGLQSAKGTSATDNFWCTIMTTSGINVTKDPIEKGVEHSCAGTGARATAKKSATSFSSFLATSRARGYLYPDAFPIWLLGAGFEDTPADQTTYWTHTLTLADRADLQWVSAMSEIGSRERKMVDARVARLLLTASAGGGGITYEADLEGLSVDTSAGTETVTNETAIDILPSEGSITLVYDPDDTAVNMLTSNVDPSMITMQIDNPLDQERQTLFTFGRDDLPAAGLRVTGAIEGLELDYTIYDQIIGATASTPSADACIASLTYTFQSANNISGAIVPYSISITIPHVELSFGSDIEANGDDTVLLDLTYEMIDDSATPITIVMTNDVTDYDPT